MTQVTMFAGEDCGPCKALKPVLVDVCGDLNVGLSIINIAGPDDPAVVKHDIRAVPTVVIEYPDGATARFTGVRSKEAIADLILENHL